MSEPLTAEELERVRRRSRDWAVADWGPPDASMRAHPETECQADRDVARLLATLDAACQPTPLTALPECMTCGAVAFDPMAGACGECGAEDRWVGSQWLKVPADNLPLDAARQPTVDVEALVAWLKRAQVPWTEAPEASWRSVAERILAARDALAAQETPPRGDDEMDKDVRACAIRIEGSLGKGVLLLGVAYRVAEIREHWQPTGIEGEPPAVSTVVLFHPVGEFGHLPSRQATAALAAQETPPGGCESCPEDHDADLHNHHYHGDSGDPYVGPQHARSGDTGKAGIG